MVHNNVMMVFHYITVMDVTTNVEYKKDGIVMVLEMQVFPNVIKFEIIYYSLIIYSIFYFLDYNCKILSFYTFNFLNLRFISYSICLIG